MSASGSRTVRSSRSATRPTSCGARWWRCSRSWSRARASSSTSTTSTSCRRSWLNSCRPRSSCTRCSCSGRTIVWIVWRIITDRWLLYLETIHSKCSKGFQSNSIKYFHIGPNSQITRITSWTWTRSTIFIMRHLSQSSHIPRVIKPSRRLISTTMCLTIRERIARFSRRWNRQYCITLTISSQQRLTGRLRSRKQGLSRYHSRGCPLSWQVQTHTPASITTKQSRGKRIWLCRPTIQISRSSNFKCQITHSQH